MEEKTDKVLLTFVVPCYNVEKYIQRCLDSIYACRLPENRFEVLCVNDCSPDSTAEILERNKVFHSNLHIVNHEVNKGLGGGRNTGILKAKGRYLWFVDSDDEVVGNGFSEALEKAVDEDLDILCFNYCRIDEKGKVLSQHSVFGQKPVMDGYSFADKVFGRSLVYHIGYVCRFLYRADFLRNQKLVFPEKVHWEDTVFMPKSILLAHRIASVSDTFYAYRVNPNSISGLFAEDYPAKSIFDFSFYAGSNLLVFSHEVQNDDLKEAFSEVAINKYINGFALFLLRTGNQERRRFYQLIKSRKRDVGSLKPYMNWWSKVMLMPFWGPILTGFLSLWYKNTH